jgi:hypothetical protein
MKPIVGRMHDNPTNCAACLVGRVVPPDVGRSHSPASQKPRAIPGISKLAHGRRPEAKNVGPSGIASFERTPCLSMEQYVLTHG